MRRQWQIVRSGGGHNHTVGRVAVERGRKSIDGNHHLRVER